jgi:hypothetical protein
MKAMTNSTVKLLAAALFVVTATNSDAGDYKYRSWQSASGNTKGDALASALQHLPYGAKIEKIGFNGSSTKQYVPGVGHTQTSGSYKCRVDYSR